MPGILQHPGASWSNIVNHLYLTSQGIYGIALGVVATYVFHYVLFGVLATRVGLGKLFIDLATCVAGRYAGGPAKVSIFGSALFGMISGSSIANTVTVGSLTIPAMIRVGYPAPFRGGRRIGGLDRRADHAADHGRRRLPDGRVPQRLLSDDNPGGDRAGVHAFLRRVHAGPSRGQACRAERASGRGDAECRQGHPRGMADDHAACRAADRAVLRLHALSRRLLGHHGLPGRRRLARARHHARLPGRRSSLPSPRACSRS